MEDMQKIDSKYRSIALEIKYGTIKSRSMNSSITKYGINPNRSIGSMQRKNYEITQKKV